MELIIKCDQKLKKLNIEFGDDDMSVGINSVKEEPSTYQSINENVSKDSQMADELNTDMLDILSQAAVKTDKEENADIPKIDENREPIVDKEFSSQQF